MIVRGTPEALDDKRMERLGQHVAMENWEKRLLPLYQFRGNTNPHRIRAMWNAAFGMFLGEAPSVGAGARMLATNCAEHLCGLHRTPQSTSLYGFFSRLHASQPLTDSISKEFTGYIRWVFPHPFHLQRVSIEAKDYREGVTAWWRTPAPRQKKVWKEPDLKPAERAYPYITRGGQKEHELLMKVHSFIPSTVPHAIRGDLCQDLIVAVLSGDVSVENIPDVIARYIRDARKVMPDIYKHKTVSLDEPIPGLDGVSLIDTVLDRYTDNFADELIEAITETEEAHGVPIVKWSVKGIRPYEEVAPKKTGWEKGDPVRVTHDALVRLPLVTQSRLALRDGVVLRGVDIGWLEVEFPATEVKKGVREKLRWDWLEAVHSCDVHCHH